MTTLKQKTEIFPENIPTELKNLKQWVLWTYQQPIDHNGKPLLNEDGSQKKATKIPLQPNGKKAESDNENTWHSFENVVSAFENNPDKFSGIGFMFKAPYVGFDTDNSIDLNTEEIDPTALFIMTRLNSYTEISPSKTGFHIIVKVDKPLPMNRYKKKGDYECYEEKRFFTFTGNIYRDQKDIHLRTKEAFDVVNKIFLKTELQKTLPPQLAASDRLSKEQVYQVMKRSKKAHKIQCFLNGDWKAAGNFPSQSEADAAFLLDLAFFTQKNPQMMEEIFCESGMYRDKWHRKQNGSYFGMIEIERAISFCNNIYMPKTLKQKTAEIQLKEAVQIEKQEMILDEKPWWQTNPNGTRSFIYFELAQAVFEKVSIVRYPTPHSDLYYYNSKKGVYEQDKSGRQLNYIIRSFDNELKISHIREVAAHIQDMSQVVNKINPNYIAVENGLINIKTFQFESFSPDVFLTQKIPTPYNPDAFDPFIDSTLRKVTDNYEPSIQNIKEMFACVLSPQLLVPKMFYLYGRSAHNGKSSILNMIHATFNQDGGNISAVSPQKLASNTFAGASMYGKLANIVDDQPDQIIEDSGTLKTVITGGYVEIERKGKDSETVKMNVTLITASNYFPNFKENGKQINRRLHIIPFDHDFSSDPDCVSDSESIQLINSQTAKEYVLKLAIETLADMLNNPAADKLTPNKKAIEAEATFAEHNDPLSDYFFEFDEKYFEEMSGTRVLKDYEDWCKDNRTIPLGAKRFKEAVCTKLNMEWSTKRVTINSVSKPVKGFKKIKQ